MSEETKKFETLTPPTTGLGGPPPVPDNQDKGQNARSLLNRLKEIVGAPGSKSWDQAVEEEIERQRKAGTLRTDLDRVLDAIDRLTQEVSKLVALAKPAFVVGPAEEPTATTSSSGSLFPEAQGLFDRTFSGEVQGGPIGPAPHYSEKARAQEIDRKSCPFCGGELRVSCGEGWHIFCPTTECPIGDTYFNSESAEEAMLRRPCDFKVLNGWRVLK